MHLVTSQKKCVRSSLAMSTIVSAAFVLGLFVFPLTSAQAEKSEKKAHAKTESSSKSDKKKHKSKDSDIESDAVVGSDEKAGNKQFDAELSAGAKVDAILILDSSASMKRTDPGRLRDQGAKLFLRFLDASDRIGILSFDRDTKVVSPLTAVNPNDLAALDQGIDAIPVQGGFTDLASPLQQALEMLSEQGRPDAEKAVILLSDGKMDPHPSRGTAAELTAQVKSTLLPSYLSKRLKLYTLSLSNEADQELLADFAKAGGGTNWIAPDASTIHKKFSELFLILKRPQVVPMEGAGFEIDSSVQEATFYVSRKDADKPIVLVDPRGQEITSGEIPTGIKWFSGNLFDVITISHPMPGKWGVRGIENPEGFATLLSDIKLQARWPEAALKLGDTVAVFARLTNKGEPVSKPGLEDIIFYTYKIVNSASGEVTQNGTLNDKGESGDEKAGDNIYSATVKLDKEGDFQGLFAATSPTFSRQQHLSFSVSTAMVTIEVEPANEFSGTHESVFVKLTEQALKLKQLKVQLVTKREGEEKRSGFTLTPDKTKHEIFPVPVEKLKQGDYELFAKITGTDAKKKPVTASSGTIKYTVKETGKDVSAEDEIEEAGTEAPKASGDLIFGILGIVLAVGWLAGLKFYSEKQIKTGDAAIEEMHAYTIPEEFVTRLNSIKERTSDIVREPSSKDRAVFSLVME